MMKHMELVEIPARAEMQLYFVSCDLCGSEIKKIGYSHNEVTISHEKGYTHPEGGNIIAKSVDMCEKCFNEKLTPWLQSQGAMLSTEERDW